jgi:hypothetical protein
MIRKLYALLFTKSSPQTERKAALIDTMNPGVDQPGNQKLTAS